MFLHDIEPILVIIGSLSIYWYGAMWALAFITIIKIVERTKSIAQEHFDTLVFGVSLGTIVGAKLGFIVFYTPISQWYSVLFNRSGLAFHGGLIGFIVALYLWSVWTRSSFWKTADQLALAIPWGLFWGRIGNFLNSELWGYPTDLPWAVVFSVRDPLLLPRHPSQLYEALAEGILLGIFLQVMKNRLTKDGQLSVLFVIFYAFARFCVEFFRMPDHHIGLIYSLSKGQWLCLFMMFSGIVIWFLLNKALVLSRTSKETGSSLF